MLRRRTPLVLSLLVVAALAACGTAEPTGSRWAGPLKAAAAAAPKTPPPRPAPRSVAEVQRQVNLAMMDLSTFRRETADHTSENTDAWLLRSLCRDSLPSDRHRTAHRERRWETPPVWITQYVVGYRKVTGRKLIDELRSVLAKCRTYETASGRTSTIVKWAPPGVPKSPDVLTFCERQKTSDGTIHQCTVMMARGHYVVEVDASDGEGDLKKSQAMLAKMYPLIAAAFIEAT